MSVLTVIRRMVRRSAKPLVMVGIAGTLSLSLIVTTPSNAQAFVPVPVLPVVAGATSMAMPSLLSASLALHPVGWAIAGTAALAIGLYATKDYWLPYVTGEMGKGGSNTVPTTGTQTRHVITGSTLSADKKTITATYSNSVPFTTDWDAHHGVVAHCKSDTTTATGYKSSVGYWSIPKSNPNSWTYQKAFTPCPTGYSVTGYIAGGGQGGGAGQFSPNLNLSDPQPAQMGGISSQYSFATTTVLKYGDMSAPAAYDPRADGAASYRVDAECIAPDGKISTASASSLGSEGGIKFPSCEAQGKGHGTGAVKVFTAAPGFAPTEILWETKRPTEDPAQPLCSPTRPTSGCKLGVKLDGQPCVVGSVECENWSSLRNDPNYSTRLSCQYGPYAVAIETCNPLERAYEPGGAPASEPNTDGNPGTRSDTMPNGQTQPKPDVGASPGGFPTTGTNPSTDDGCTNPSWSWNPVDFVKSPVVCALKDAFVPKQDIQARSNQMAADAAGTVPIAWMTSPIAGPSGGGCPNWVVTVGGFSENVICNSSYTAALVGARGPLFGLVATAMIWPLIRSIWYASIPVLRVSPGSSK